MMRTTALSFSSLLLVAACGEQDRSDPTNETQPTALDGGVELVVTSHLDDLPSFPTCLYGSPLLGVSRGEEVILVVPERGAVTAISATTGKTVFEVALPVREGEQPQTLATPVVAGNHLYVAYQSVPEKGEERLAHWVAAIDLEARALDPALPVVQLSAEKRAYDGHGMVTFRADRAASRSALVFANSGTAPEGYVYVAYGNIRDIQPWHGWVFELDIAAWRRGAAISSVLLTTAEDDCPRDGHSGSRDMICGGGVWSPAGPVIDKRDAEPDFTLIVPTGNGLLDLTRKHYANSVMRVKPGLSFDPGCDMSLCEPFDPAQPSDACVASCSDIFMPRLRAEDAVPAPSSGACNGKTLMECYAVLDYDLGAGSPALAKVGARRLWVLPAKDGSVYLFDADKLGTMYDREVITDQCGAPNDACEADWAGTMVTDPAIVEDNGETLALIPTFMFDHTHPAGLVALAVVDDASGPHLERRWQFPATDSEEARQRFRTHPSRVATFANHGQTFAAVVDVAVRGAGTLIVTSVSDGAVHARHALRGAGRKYVRPLIHGDVLWTSSCSGNNGPGSLEALKLGWRPVQ